MESRIELTERLRREGRWDEASRWREDRRKLLRTEGKSRQDANAEAWSELAAKYPPLPRSQSDGDIGIGGYVWPAGTAEQFDVQGDLRWAYQHLGHVVQPADAPTGAAWMLLQWARRSPDRFFASIFSKLRSNRAPKSPEMVDKVHEDDNGLLEILRMLRKPAST